MNKIATFNMPLSETRDSFSSVLQTINHDSLSLTVILKKVNNMIRPYTKDDDIEDLFPVISSWLAECKANEFGIVIEMPAYIDTVYRLIHHDDCDLMVMEFKDKIIGVMGITSTKCPIGDQVIANALYWYTLPEHRGKGISFILEARRWARKKGCSHIIFNASKMASEMHDRVCRIYEGINMKKFETSYILKTSLKD